GVTMEGSDLRIVALRDITARKIADLVVRERQDEYPILARLIESEDRYRDLVEHSHDLICTHDFSGRILSANAAAVKMLEIPLEELMTMRIQDILMPHSVPMFPKYLDELQRNGVARGKMYVRTRSGAMRIWEYENTLRTLGVTDP